LYSSALNTQLVDNTFPEDDFEVILGSLEVKWQRIGPYLFVSNFVQFVSMFLKPQTVVCLVIACSQQQQILFCHKLPHIAFFTFSFFFQFAFLVVLAVVC